MRNLWILNSSQLIYPFVDPLSSYKRKDDLIILAGALGLNTVGTISELATLIRSHLASNSNVRLNSRFSGLFLQNRRRRVDNGSGITVDTGV